MIKVIGGDLNLDLIKYVSNKAVTAYINCLLSCGCVSLINKLPESQLTAYLLCKTTFTQIPLMNRKSMMLASLFWTYLIICLFL